MERPKLPQPKDDITRKALEHAWDNAMGVPQTLTEAPSKEQVKVNQIAVVDTDIYWRMPSGKLLKLSATEVE